VGAHGLNSYVSQFHRQALSGGRRTPFWQARGAAADAVLESFEALAFHRSHQPPAALQQQAFWAAPELHRHPLSNAVQDQQGYCNGPTPALRPRPAGPASAPAALLSSPRLDGALVFGSAAATAPPPPRHVSPPPTLRGRRHALARVAAWRGANHPSPDGSPGGSPGGIPDGGSPDGAFFGGSATDGRGEAWWRSGALAEAAAASLASLSETRPQGKSFDSQLQPPDVGKGNPALYYY